MKYIIFILSAFLLSCSEQPCNQTLSPAPKEIAVFQVEQRAHSLDGVYYLNTYLWHDGNIAASRYSCDIPISMLQAVKTNDSLSVIHDFKNIQEAIK
jgi:hypothetical protein